MNAQVDKEHSLGFFAHPNRFNVALTRAKALLVVVMKTVDGWMDGGMDGWRERVRERLIGRCRYKWMGRQTDRQTAGQTDTSIDGLIDSDRYPRRDQSAESDANRSRDSGDTVDLGEGNRNEGCG